jgi:hypothetical protein
MPTEEAPKPPTPEPKVPVSTVEIEKPQPTKLTTPLPPVINATNALQHTFGSALKGLPSTGTSQIPPNRPQTVIGRGAGHLLQETNPPVLKDARLTSQIRATMHPDLATFPPVAPVVTKT